MAPLISVVPYIEHGARHRPVSQKINEERLTNEYQIRKKSILNPGLLVKISRFLNLLTKQNYHFNVCVF